MMFPSQGSSRNHCNLLAVLCCESFVSQQKQVVSDTVPSYPFPELKSAGRLEVQLLYSPTVDEFRQALETSHPAFIYFQGEQFPDSEEQGSLVWGDVRLSSAEALSDLFGSTLPNAVSRVIPYGEELAEALHTKGIPYVIYWKDTFSSYAACHFRQSLFYVLQSSCSHSWDAFQLAHASYRLYYVRNNLTMNDHEAGVRMGPSLIGDPPKVDVFQPEIDAEDEESNSETLPAISIYDEDVIVRFLLCGLPSTLDACLLESLEDGLNALLNIEIRGAKLQSRASAPLPPLQAASFSRGVVTMRCDLSTCSTTHISILVSGSPETCFNDHFLENHIKNELVGKSQLVRALPRGEEKQISLSEPRKSSSIACGASVFDVSVKAPAWASQVLRQLAPDASYRSLVALGIASIQGVSVASFEKEDAERLLFFCTNGKVLCPDNSVIMKPPSWLIPPVPSFKRPRSWREIKPLGLEGENGISGQKLKAAAMRPIPHTRHQKMLPFSGASEGDRLNGEAPRASLTMAPPKHNIAPAPLANRKAVSTSYHAPQIVSLNPLPLKKHACDRSPIHSCSEEEFLRDVMQFLILRGHTRLIPQSGFAEFPDAVLNAKRLDLYNLYREVVSRGGFHVGNGINWKGQVFSKMRNHTLTNRMTGVGNTLKRHYETYLLEYELAHDDVDGECCLLCRSSAAGDWVNCGICGEWAHFGCDRRQGLGAFKDYAKTDGLEYVCPHCSVANLRKKSQKSVNGYS
uniref:ARID domain-containing protein n=1 Tax=Kalanchoe fedtschenkoi TaxID=63787 RepID=A0A7N0UY56_KALFE